MDCCSYGGDILDNDSIEMAEKEFKHLTLKLDGIEFAYVRR